MSKILVFGGFDFLHPGHLFFLKEAKKHGDQLYVIVARDEILYQYKKRHPVHNEQHRLKALKALPFVHSAQLGDHKEGFFEVFDQINPNSVVLGHDQKTLKEALVKHGFQGKFIQLQSYQRDKFSSSLYYHKHKNTKLHTPLDEA